MTDFIATLHQTGLGPIFAFLFGAIWGSFFNVCIVRLPQDESLRGRSHCRQCKGPIRWFDNIPLISFLILRGKCRQCHARFAIEYWLVELGTALSFMMLYWHYGPTWQWVAYTVLVSLLIVISVIDLHHQIIPDELSLPGCLVGFLFCFVTGDVIWWHSLLGFFFGGGIFYAVATLYEKFAKREGLGGGDVKLLAMLGAWLGYESILPIVIVSSFGGSLIGLGLMAVKKKDFKAAIPFGPFLAFGAIVYLFWGDQLQDLFFPPLP